MIGKGASGLADAGGNVFDKLGIDTQLDNKQLQGDVVAALKKSGIPSLQPDNSDAVIKELIGKLKKHGEAISQDIDQDALKKSLVENTDMTRQQVDQIVKIWSRRKIKLLS
ncbi:hypothetical protein [Serratia symbiotica]|uniref:hypothetical protein n=1 Tax=Serratia symbiotica TaxID=138074 RepID=UPI000A588786|nr:hypothetical protein [Serratia symbiotica]